VDWVQYRLGDIVSAVSGQVDPTAPEHKNRPYVGPHNIVPNSGRLVDVISAEEARRISGMYEFDSSHVLYCKIGPMQNKVAIPDFDGICGSEIYPLIVDEEKITREFLAYSLRQPKFLNYVRKHSNRAVIPKMNRKMLFEYVISVPPIYEQEKIAAILDKSERIEFDIELTHSIRDNLIYSVYDSMFGDPWNDSMSFGKVGLSEVIKSSRYGPRFYNDKYSEEGIKVARITDLDVYGNLNYDSMPKYDMDDDTFDKHRLRCGEIIFARSGSVGLTYLVGEKEPDAIAGAYFIIIEVSDDFDPRFVYHTLRHPTFQSHIKRVAQMTSQPNFSGPALRRLQIPKPPINLQQKFAHFDLNFDSGKKMIQFRMELSQNSSSSIAKEMLT